MIRRGSTISGLGTGKLSIARWRCPTASYTPDKHCININDLVIDKIYRFTGQNDPDDEAILYAMHNKSDGAKGVFVNGYGTYTDTKADEIISKIAVHENDADDWTIDCSGNC